MTRCSPAQDSWPSGCVSGNYTGLRLCLEMLVNAKIGISARYTSLGGLMETRDRVVGLAALALAGVAAGCARKQNNGSALKLTPAPDEARGLIARASGPDPAANARTAVEALGGMDRFVKRGDVVVVKPNAAWQRAAAQAANTNPDVLRAVIEMCQKAGAAKVIVLEHTTDTPAQLCFAMSGIADAVKATGAELVSAHLEGQYTELALPDGKVLRSVKIPRVLTQADCLINVPIVKDHSQTRATIGLKNLMGLVWDRQSWHTSPSLSQCIADLAAQIPIRLSVLDATRVMTGGGPKGPGPVRAVGQVIASGDPVAADAYGSQYLGLQPHELDYLQMAEQAGVGRADYKTLKLVDAGRRHA